MKGKFTVEYPAGSSVAVIHITGESKNQEPETVRIQFPWGNVEVVRARDGLPLKETQYWVHAYVNHPLAGDYIKGETVLGRITDARLDQSDKHASDSDLGDFNRPELYHLAVKVGAAQGPGAGGEGTGGEQA